MKSSLVLDIISTHFNGTDEDFRQAVERLATDEDRKGNSALALEIRKATRGIRSTYGDRPSTVAYLQSEDVREHDGSDGEDLIVPMYPGTSLEDMVLEKGVLNELQEIIIEWRRKDRLPEGIHPTSRILMTGPPGCGKTMAAGALANSLGLEMAYVRLDGLISQYMGQTRSNLRRVFDSVSRRRSLLFIDEFDAVGKTRADYDDVGESKRILTTLLQNMDLLDSGIPLVVATNMPELLDPAVLRRFETTLRFELPDLSGRERMVELLASRYRLPNDYDLNAFAGFTEGMSYAEIETAFKAMVRYVAVNDVRGPLDRSFLSSFLGRSGNVPDIWEMRRAGYTLKQISETTGIPISTVHYRLRRGRDA